MTWQSKEGKDNKQQTCLALTPERKLHLLLDITCETNAAKAEHAGMTFWRHKREQDIEMILLHCIYCWLGYLENYLIDFFFFVFKYRTVTSDSTSYILQQCSIIKWLANI